MTASSPPTTSAVAENPSSFVGKRLTLVGEVDAVFNERAFELEGNEALFDSSLLVLTRSPVRIGGQTLRDDDRVSVTGTVRNFVVAELERDLDWDLNPELEVEWRNRRAFVAESISKVAEQARWSEKESERDGVLLGMVSTLYVADPKTLAGHKIELASVPVQQRMGEGLWLGAEHTDQIFIAPADAAKLPNVQAGDRIDVTGTIREMPSAQEAISRWSLQPQLAEQIEDEVIYIEAQSVQQSKEPRGTAQREQEKPGNK